MMEVIRNLPRFWNLYSAPVLVWIVNGVENGGREEMIYTYVVYPYLHSALDDQL
jgi:hypothetical protein